AGPAAAPVAARVRGRGGPADPRREMPGGERAGGGHEAQRGAPVEARAGQLLAAQAEQRVARVEIIGVAQLITDALVAILRDASLLGHRSSPVRVAPAP